MTSKEHALEEGRFENIMDSARQSADVVILRLTKEIKREQMKRQVPWYFLMLACLVVNICLTDAEFSSSDRYYRVDAARVEANGTRFRAIQKTADFYDWLGDFAANGLWPDTTVTTTQPESPNMHVGAVVLRQYRVFTKTFISGSTTSYHKRPPEFKVLPSSITKHLRNTTTLAYSAAWLEAFPYPTGVAGPSGPYDPPWVSNRDAQSRTIKGIRKPPTSIAIQGRLAYYGELSYSFTLAWSANGDRNTILPQVEKLRRAFWIDDATRMVAVEFITYNKIYETFIFTTFFIEFSSSGLVLATIRNIPLVLHTFWDKIMIVVAISDFFILGFVVFDIFGMIATIQHNTQRVGESMWEQITFWRMVNISFILVFALAYVSKIELWYEGFTINSSDYYNKTGEFGNDEHAQDLLMFDTFARHASVFQTCYTRLCIGNLIAWVRILDFLQYSDQFGVLSNALSKSVSLLWGWLLTFLIIFCPYMIAGNILYGSAVQDFKSLASTAAFLILMIARGEIDGFNTLNNMYPVWTPLYFISYLSLTWLVMLNMFIAIITDSFQVVQNPDSSSDLWHPQRILDRMAVFIKDKALQLVVKNFGMGRKKGEEEEEKRIIITERMRSRAIDKIREKALRDEVVDLSKLMMNRKECFEYAQGSLPMSHIYHLFKDAEFEEHASESWKKVTEKWTRLTEKSLVILKDLDLLFNEIKSNLDGTGNLLYSLRTIASERGSKLQMFLISLGTVLDLLQEEIHQTNSFLPEAHVISEGLSQISADQARLREVSRKVSSVHRDLKRLHNTIERTLRLVTKTGDFFSGDMKRLMWGIEADTFDDVAPIVMEASAGTGNITRIEKLGLRKTITNDEYEPKTKESTYSTWLKTKIDVNDETQSLHEKKANSSRIRSDIFNEFPDEDSDEEEEEEDSTDDDSGSGSTSQESIFKIEVVAPSSPRKRKPSTHS